MSSDPQEVSKRVLANHNTSNNIPITTLSLSLSLEFNHMMHIHYLITMTVTMDMANCPPKEKYTITNKQTHFVLQSRASYLRISTGQHIAMLLWGVLQRVLGPRVWTTTCLQHTS